MGGWGTCRCRGERVLLDIHLGHVPDRLDEEPQRDRMLERYGADARFGRPPILISVPQTGL
jgi:hypothetical protein